MNELTTDLDVFRNICSAMQNSNKSEPSLMIQTVISREDVKTEINILHESIKASCQKLVQIMTQDEIALVDISKLVQMFGNEMKLDIVNLIKSKGVYNAK
jgi:hypothetical protein